MREIGDATIWFPWQANQQAPQPRIPQSGNQFRIGKALRTAPQKINPRVSIVSQPGRPDQQNRYFMLLISLSMSH
jgi:hypothetical protein